MEFPALIIINIWVGQKLLRLYSRLEFPVQCLSVWATRGVEHDNLGTAMATNDVELQAAEAILEINKGNDSKKDLVTGIYDVVADHAAPVIGNGIADNIAATVSCLISFKTILLGPVTEQVKSNGHYDSRLEIGGRKDYISLLFYYIILRLRVR